MSFSRVRIFLSLKNPEVLGSTASKPPKKDMPSTSFVIHDKGCSIIKMVC